MAHYKPTDGFDNFTGALKKTREPGVDHISVTRIKHYHDPITDEEIGTGPKEVYVQNCRDYDEHPLSANEKKNRGDWQKACRDALPIIRDKSHPRYMELYHRWREQLTEPEPYTQFQGFVRAVMMQEQ